jgi:hypothetical protein
MVDRFVSVATLLCVVIVAIVGIKSPNYPLFLFISSNLAVGLARISLVLLMIKVSFCQRIGSMRVCKYLGWAGIGLMSLAACSLWMTSVEGALYNFLKPMDLLLIMEAGVIFSLASLNSTSATAKPEQLKLSLSGKP